jgi:tight adherence protein C
MLEQIFSLIRTEMLVTAVIAVAAFAAVLTAAAPMMENNTLKARMKAVGVERDKLRAEQNAKLNGGEVRLRDRQQKSLSQQLVDGLRLRRVFEAESTRDLLRQAGYRSERHLVTFLTIRLVAPFVVAMLAFAYSGAIETASIPHARLVATFLGMVAGYYLPVLLVKNLITRRQQSIRQAWSDALDLMVICVESGMTVEPALQRVSREIGSISVPLAEELTLTVAELSYLQDRRKAFENLAKRTGMATVKSVVTSLIQSERYGTPLSTALRVLAQENRDMRMQEAEKKAAALPPKLTVPMILFFLPAVFVVVLGPSILNLMKIFGGG